MHWISRGVLGLLALSLVVTTARAATVSVNPDGSTTWRAGVDGVEVQRNANGSFRRLSSKYTEPVDFSDRRGIEMAYTIAEEKAKAAIIRFIKQDLTSTRTVTEIQSDLDKAVQKKHTGGTPNTSTTNTRSVEEALTEITTSFAAGTLRGVVVLEQGFDKKEQDAWVVVGISSKSMKAARQLHNDIEGNGAPDSKEAPAGKVIDQQPSEIHTTKQNGW